MQSFNNIVKVLLLVTIYCFGLVNSADALTNFNQTPLSENSEQKSYFTASNKLLSPHAQQTEVSHRVNLPLSECHGVLIQRLKSNFYMQTCA